MHACTHACMRTYMHPYRSIYVHPCIRARARTHTHTHTHVHTQVAKKEGEHARLTEELARLQAAHDLLEQEATRAREESAARAGELEGAVAAEKERSAELVRRLGELTLKVDECEGGREAAQRDAAAAAALAERRWAALQAVRGEMEALEVARGKMQQELLGRIEEGEVRCGEVVRRADVLEGEASRVGLLLAHAEKNLHIHTYTYICMYIYMYTCIYNVHTHI